MGLLNSDSGNLVYIVPQSSYYYSKGSQDETADEQEELDYFVTDSLTEKADARLILSATEHFEKIETATTTNFPVSSSGSQGDHYRPNGPVITFRGVVSESSVTLFQGLQQFDQVENFAKGIANEAFIESYISKVRETLRMMKGDDGEQAYPLVNIHLPDNNTENNCLITSFKISRDKKVGNGYYVDITAQKLLIADSSFSVVPASDFHQPEVQSTSSSSETFKDSTIGDLKAKAK